MNNKQKQTKLSSTIAALLLTGLVATTVQAGKIVAQDRATIDDFAAEGFGGWNLDNIRVVVDGDDSSFNEADGSYVFSSDSDNTYFGEVYDKTFGIDIVPPVDATLMGYVLAKDWPVGEPSGIKIINRTADLAPEIGDKPVNCIMATSYLDGHFLDSEDPRQVTCDSPFQTHKRYKLAMLENSVADGTGHGIDLVFNVEDERGSRDYQVFQKINNWTNGRLEGFKIEVGTGIGIGFTPASDPIDGVGVANLSLSIPDTIWSGDQLANFSAGLFGPADPHHDRDPGFFDRVNPAGFSIAEYGTDEGNSSGLNDTLNSLGPLGSDYAEVPLGAADQFGPWLSDNMLPYGIFWDDDGNPETDAQLLAWYGCNPALPLVEDACALGWMTGASDVPGENFAEVSGTTIESWGENLEYTMGEIDDLVNVGLNYIVTVGDDVSGFTDSRFTIRITPKVDTSGAGDPAYVGAIPDPLLQFVSDDGVVTISPSPVFAVGELLTLRVGDANPVLPVIVKVTDDNVDSSCVIEDGGSFHLVELIDQGEEGDDRGVYAATTDVFSNVDLAVGTKVTVIYNDTDTDGDGTSEMKCATTTASADGEPLPLVNVLITDFSAPASLFVDQTGRFSVTITNGKDSEASVSGRVIISGNNGSELYNEAFSDLAPNRKLRIPTTWTAFLINTNGDPEVVEWTVTVDIDDQAEDIEANAFTEVSVKPGKDNNNGNN